MEQNAPSPENAAQTATVRAALRREKIAAREALPAALHAAHSARIEASLEDLFAGAAAAILGFCWPLRGEFDARPLAERLLARGWRACLPLLVAEDAPLAFREWTPASPLLPDRYGIPTPVAGANLTPAVLLIPLVAFDAANYRIGYGGGFFDRTLAVLAPRPQAIGVGFELARVPSIQPQTHDLPLDIIVTEAGLRHRGIGA